MPDSFDVLLEATLRHLRDLKASGTRHVPISQSALAALTRSQPRKATPSPPASPPSPPPAAPAPSRLQSSPPPFPAPPVQVPSRAPAPTQNSAPTSAPPVPAIPNPPPLPAAATPRDTAPALPRAEALAQIRDRALVCQKCPNLVRTRTQVVFGVGHPEAELMFVGEAPGADEDRLGEPFVGRAGQLLTRIIQTMGFTRETVYIANILKCRPDLPPGERGNRPPTAEEMDTCKPYLLSQIEIIQPKVLVALGNTAVQGLLGIRSTMGSVRGRWHSFRGVPVMPTFHPSYLVRAEDAPDRGYSEKRKTWEDMLAVLEKLERPISDKMRGYFLKRPGSDGA